MVVVGNFRDFYNATMLPALREIVETGRTSRPPQFSRVFYVQSSDRSIEQFSQISGVGRFAAIEENGKIARDQPVQGFNSTFQHTRFGLSVSTSKDMVEDDKWGIIKKQHKDLGWSCQETRELQAVATINNGFSASAPYTGPDGVALFSASHPLYKIGGVQSNLMTAADLDMFPLQIALTAWEKMKRPSGELVRWPAAKLIVEPTNRFIAYALTKSADTDPTTADRSVNPLAGAENGMLKTFVWNYLSSTIAWFLAAEPENTGLVWFDRRTPYTSSWVDDETEAAILGMRYKKSSGFNDYVGLLGNLGV